MGDDMTSRARPRISLPALDRTAPIRNGSTVFGPGTSRPTAPPHPGSIRDAVELGYRVIDELVRSGREAASSLRPWGWAAQGAAAAPEDLAQLGLQMVQATSEFMSTWLQTMQRMAGAAATAAPPAPGPEPREPPDPPGPPHPEPTPAPAPASPERSRVRVGVSSQRMTHVEIDLRAGAARSSCVVHQLRPVSAEATIPPIPVTSRVEDGALCVELVVPPEQPAGRYNACIVDAVTGIPQGTLSLLIAAGS
jgi:hypothetical protein